MSTPEQPGFEPEHGSATAVKADADVHDEQHKPESDHEKETRGFVEYISADKLAGWAISRTGAPVLFAVQIDGIAYFVEAIWSERSDVAQTLGTHNASVGFTLRPGGPLRDLILQAIREGRPIEVVANGSILSRADGVVPEVIMPEVVVPDIVVPAVEVPSERKPARAYLERLHNFTFIGWAINEQGKPADLQVRINNEIVDCFITRDRDPDVANALGVTDGDECFQIELPGTLWERVKGAGGKVEVLVDGESLTTEPLNLTRKDAIQWISDILQMDEGLEKQYFSLLAMEHVRYGHFFQQLDDKIQRLVHVLSNRFQLQDFIFAGSAPSGASPAMSDSTLPLRKELLRYGKGRISGSCRFGETARIALATGKQSPLDQVFYRACYPDLAHLSDSELASHWQKNGKWENRHPNLEELLKSQGYDPSDPKSFVFDPFFYWHYHDDIQEAGLTTDLEIKLHYLLNGKKEGRIPTLRHWMEGNKYDPDILPAGIDLKTIFSINEEAGVEITLRNIFQLLAGESGYPVRISRDNTVNADFYLDIAEHYLLKHQNKPARNLLRLSLMFDKRIVTLELLGNTYVNDNNHLSAAACYRKAADKKGFSKWMYPNFANSEAQAGHSVQAIETLLKGIEVSPENTLLHGRLDECVNDYWRKQQSELEACSVIDDRGALISRAVESTSLIYQSYLRAYGVSKNPEQVQQCNLANVMIVGDYFLPQCRRYRIEQKIEQLEAAGIKVTAVSWREIDKEMNKISLHDAVIFYRVPAEPMVLKAMAQVNAVGKLSLYEIDDLLFDPVYPPPIETYGGYLDLNTYVSLTRGMALFNAAARCCRYGIASTKPLAEKLRTLVFGAQCFVHRNGLDSVNYYRKPVLQAKPYIDIFYGSGTLAHNSDFLDLALPAITRILDEYSHTRLTIAGHLKLPARFVERYPDRVKQIPLIENLRDYWSQLGTADINIAVLHDDETNGCKSELKWFEAACLGIPSVVSKVANYRDVINHGVDGLMAATAEEWYQNLKILVDDPGMRQEMAERAQERVLSEYSIDALSRNITTLLDEAHRLALPAKRPQRKKIALVNVFFPPQSVGGGTRVVADNFDLLVRDYDDRFELCVFTTDTEHKPPYQLMVYEYKGVRVYRSTVLWRENMDWHSGDAKMGELFSEFLATEQPDLIHFHCIQRLTGSIVEAAQAARVPYLVTIHDAWWISDYQFLMDENGRVYPEGHADVYESRMLPEKVSRSESIGRILYLKKLLKGAKHVLTVSDTFADLYRKNGISQVQVNKNGISEIVRWRAKDTSYTDKVVCAHIGGMAEHKGYFILKTAVEALQPEHIEMLIVDHSKEEGYQLQTLWGKVPVTFIGRVDQRRIADLYGRIDVLFAPSTWPESYGLVTREAAACTCWVVASSMGGIAEDVREGESGFVVKPNVVDLAACLETIDLHPARFKGPAQPPPPRKAGEQVKELAAMYAAMS